MIKLYEQPNYNDVQMQMAIARYYLTLSALDTSGRTDEERQLSRPSTLGAAKSRCGVGGAGRAVCDRRKHGASQILLS
ncbi:MAG: hypothetical protein R3B90_20605 [Planctomycetaceae bacterium]